MHNLHEPWTANVVGRMHRYDITAEELASKCGYSPQYVSMLLNGKKNFKNEESRIRAKRIIFDGLHRMEMEVRNERVSD